MGVLNHAGRPVQSQQVKAMRLESKADSTRDWAQRPHKFVQIQGVAQDRSFVIPRHSSERRSYLPVGLLNADAIVADSAFAIYDAPLWNLALIASRIHLVWIASVCGKIKTDYRYSNTIGWNTFPVPTLTSTNKDVLNHAAEKILSVRETYFPATISEMYDPDRLENEFTILKAAHDHNDEIVEQIYIGRRFRNDTERLEKLMALASRNRRH